MTNTVLTHLHVESKQKQKQKTNSKKRSDFWLPEAESKRGKQNLKKVIKWYKLPVIRSISTRDVIYSVMTIVNTAV